MRSLRDLLAGGFAAQTLQRGVAHARAGAVSGIERKAEHLSATVRGHDRYTTTVELPGLLRGRAGFVAQELITSCTCPDGEACEHAVALVVAWSALQGLPTHPEADAAPDRDDDDADDQASDVGSSASEPDDAADPRPPPDPWRDLRAVAEKPWQPDERSGSAWIDHLPEPDERATNADDIGLLYLVEPSASDARDLRVAFVGGRRLRSGARGVGRRYRTADEARRHPSLTNGDREILRILHGRGDDPGPLTGDALARMIATGRAFWLSQADEPLGVGPSLPVVARWVEQRGRLRVAFAAPDGAAVETMPTVPPWYRDGARCGPLDTGIADDELAAHVARMPWLEPPQARLAAARLARSLPRLPPPPLPAVEPPTPRLRIVTARASSWGRGHAERDVDIAVPTMRYGPHELPLAQRSPICASDDGDVIVRDEAAEQERLRELVRLGLEHPPTGWSLDAPHGHLALVRAGALAATPGGGRIAPSIVAALRGSGWEIVGTTAADDAVEVSLDAATAEIAEGSDDGQDWFEVRLGVQVGDRRVDLVPVLTPLLRGGEAAWGRLPRAAGEPPALLATCDDRTVLRVPLAVLRDLHDRLVELFDRPAAERGWRIEAERADLVDALDRLSPRWIGADRLRALAERLRSCAAPPAVAPPPTLRAELRPYQRDGLAWLQHLMALGLGGVLADDMGLGKTVQAIAHLATERAAGRADRPSLVACPASVVGVWRDELARFAPDLRVAIVHGAGRAKPATLAADVVVTSHATLARSIADFAEVAWHVAICDEAQAMKNPATRLASAMRELDARQRLCLTGTPVENHLGELHALMAWVAPGALGGAAAFDACFRRPIEDERDAARAALLRRRVAPFLLRRTKQAVAADLPPRTDIDVPVELADEQRALYDTLRLAMDQRVRAAVADRGLARSGLELIEALLRLRQACCDPRLLPAGLARGCTASAKLEALAELVTTLAAEGRATLVFSQFTSLLDLVESEVLAPRSIAWLRLDGQTRDRQGLVERFQDGAAPVFLLSLKAAGTGLTLTRADSVVLLDPWWNPAVERQAADRAHRIGQQRPVTIYRLIATGTVEERIRALQTRKAALADALLDESGQSLGKLTVEDIEALLAPIEAAGEGGAGAR